VRLKSFGSYAATALDNLMTHLQATRLPRSLWDIWISTDDRLVYKSLRKLIKRLC
jgi:hypothetical protein